MQDDLLAQFLESVRASARSGSALILQPEHVQLLVSMEVYPVLAKLEARALQHHNLTSPDAMLLAHAPSERVREQDDRDAPSTHNQPNSVEALFAEWLKYHVADLAAPDRYRYSVRHWFQFFEEERRAGRLVRSPIIADLTPELQRRFRDWRCAAGAGGHTISRDLAALRGALSFARKNQRIDRAPYIADVPMHLRGSPRDRVLSFEEIASILDACASKPHREHLVRFIAIELGTAGRPQAVLELTDANIDLRRNLIDPNQPGRTHARKRRAIVPIARAVRPWVTGITGKLIRYRVPVRGCCSGEQTVSYFERPTKSIRRSWGAACREAGVSGATPKTLRHTMLSWLAMRGVPAEQRRVFAGHCAQGTTARNYEHLSPTHLKNAVQEVDAFFTELRKYTSAIDPPPS
jgi:integrase